MQEIPLRVFLRLAFAALVAALVTPLQLTAQIGGNGTIEGVISDPSGAIVPGATVEATQVATGVKTVRQTTARPATTGVSAKKERLILLDRLPPRRSPFLLGSCASETSASCR